MVNTFQNKSPYISIFKALTFSLLSRCEVCRLHWFDQRFTISYKSGRVRQSSQYHDIIYLVASVHKEQTLHIKIHGWRKVQEDGDIVFGQILPGKFPASSCSSHFWTCSGEKEKETFRRTTLGNNTRHGTSPWRECVCGVTYPADGAQALVDPLVPVAGSGVLVSGSQSFVTSVEICRKHREEDEMSEQEINY